MRESSGGFGLVRALLVVTGVVVFLIVAFWAALIVIGVAAVYLLARAVIRAVTGRGRSASPTAETILIEPGHRSDPSPYDNGNVIVLPITPASEASTTR